jgi:hypothetical protein
MATFLRLLHYLRFLFSLRHPRKLFAYHLFVSVSLLIEWYVALVHSRCGATKDENGRKRSKTDLRYRKTKTVGSGYFYI